MINKIGKITVYVNDQEAAKHFWCNQLNFVVTFEKQMGPGLKWIEIAPSIESQTTFVLYDKKMMLTQKPDANVSHSSIILSTTDIAAAYEKMKNNGVQVGPLMQMPYGSMFTFKDNEGNPYMLREDK